VGEEKFVVVISLIVKIKIKIKIKIKNKFFFFLISLIHDSLLTLGEKRFVLEMTFLF